MHSQRVGAICCRINFQSTIIMSNFGDWIYTKIASAHQRESSSDWTVRKLANRDIDILRNLYETLNICHKSSAEIPECDSCDRNSQRMALENTENRVAFEICLVTDRMKEYLKKYKSGFNN